MQHSIPSDLITAYNATSHTTTTLLQSHNCQKSAKTPKTSISGEKLLNKNHISGAVSINSKKSNRSSKDTIKSDSDKGSKTSEDFSHSYSPLNWDTPSFTENLNVYDFVTDEREQFHGNSDVLTFHGPEGKNSNGPTTHDTAFCLDRSDSRDSNGSKKQRDNSKPILRIRANKRNSSNQNFNQDTENLDTLTKDIQSRKQIIQDLKDKLLDKFEDENAWIQDLQKVRKRMRPLSNHQTSYVN